MRNFLSFFSKRREKLILDFVENLNLIFFIIIIMLILHFDENLNFNLIFFIINRSVAWLIHQ